MSKERLEEIRNRMIVEKQHFKYLNNKKGYWENVYTLLERDMKYLFDTIIEQAERAERLKEENAGLHDILAQIEYQEKDKLLAENKRYREVIKKAIDDLENECLWDALVALKVLEGMK